jgi:hypothetical protein
MNGDEALAALLRLRASMGDLENALPDSERCIRSASYAFRLNTLCILVVKC